MKNVVGEASLQELSPLVGLKVGVWAGLTLDEYNDHDGQRVCCQ